MENFLTCNCLSQVAAKCDLAIAEIVKADVGINVPLTKLVKIYSNLTIGRIVAALIVVIFES